jgi:hypothetical protein
MADIKPELIRQINPETNRPEPEAVLESTEKEKNETSNETANKKPMETTKPTEQTEKVRHSRPTNLTAIQPIRDQLTRRVEKILEEGLAEPFHRLSPLAQQEFKLKGEQTASKIGELLKSTHIKVKKIFQLIMEWLKLLPGINRFFLEQEAKIKTDRIIALHKNL